MKEGEKKPQGKADALGICKGKAVLAKAAGCPWDIHPALERGAHGGSLLLACSPRAVPAHHHHPQDRLFVGGSGVQANLPHF